MGDLRDLLIDQYTALSHKTPVDERRNGGPGVSMAPTWVGNEHHRRLNAYKLLKAYLENSARTAIPSVMSRVRSQSELDQVAGDVWGGERPFGDGGSVTSDGRKDHREYGDAALLVNVITDRLLGDEVTVVVDGAGEEPPDTPSVPEPPAPLGAEPTDVDRRVFEALQERWQRRADEALDRWLAQLADHEGAVERQEWLRTWAEDERLVLKMLEVELDATGMGDGVYVLGWSRERRRPVVSIYDPGFYFPVLGPNDDTDYPRKVHVAWEFEETIGTTTRTYVRRITWELRRLEEPRHYPWQTEDEEPSPWACFMSDGIWRFDSLGRRKVNDLSDDAAEWLVNEDGTPVRDLDLGIDFIPVVHIPNTPARKEHFGRSVLTSVAQILDDIHSADTDLHEASGTTGTPMVAISGTTPASGPLVVGPGVVFTLGKEGSATLLDTSGALDALLKYVESLLARLSVNAQVPAEVLGRVQASEVPSGLALMLAFGPLRGLVRKMRLVRGEKYPLLLKFVQRLGQVGGVLEAGPIPRAEVAFGSFLPSDQAAVLDQVIKLLGEHGISRPTALRWLADAGFDVGDISEEIERIEAEDFEGASALFEASGDDEAVRRRLRLSGESARPEASPEIDLPT